MVRIFKVASFLINFEIQKQTSYQNKLRFNNIYSKKIYHLISSVINFGKYDSIRTHQRTLYVNGDKVTYFDTFEVEYIQKKKRKKKP